MNLRRSARRHEAGVDPQDYWRFTPGDRVVTIEGLIGTVTAVEDGPHPGAEHYIVELDDGMGGGEYDVEEIHRLEGDFAAAASKTAMADRSGIPEVDALIEEFLNEPLDDFNGTLVRDLLDPALSHGTCYEVTAQFVEFAKARGFNAYVTDTNLEEMGYETSGEAQGEVLDPDGNIVQGFYSEHTVASIYPEGQRFPVYVDFTATQYGYTDHPKVTSSKTAAVPVEREDGTVDFVDSMEELDEVEGSLHTAAEDYPELGDILSERLPLPHSQRIAKTAGRPPNAIDCWYCKGTGDVPGTATECAPCDGSGYLSPGEVRELRAEGGILDRILEPWADHAISQQPEHIRYNPETGEMPSHDWCRFRKRRRCFYPKELHEAATAQMGYAVWVPEDRGYCPRHSWEDQKACPAPSEPGPNSGDPNARLDATIPWEQGGQRMGGLLPIVSVQTDTSVEEATQTRKRPPSTEKNPLVEELAEVVEERRQKKTKPANPYSDANPYSAAREPEFTWHLTAAWKDVQQKAKGIRGGGGVRVISASPMYLVAEVKGETNVYQTTLMREPGRRAIAMWECGCAWAAYSWGRSGRWKKYEGRLCSHALALNYEGMSRGWVDGNEVAEDAKAPPWRGPKTKVMVPGDYDRGEKGEWRVGSLDDDEDFGRVASTDPSLAEPPVLGIARDMLRDGDDPNEVIATLVALGVADAPGILREALAQPFLVQVRNMVRKVIDLLPGKVVVDGVGEVAPQECLYPTYHPSRGLSLSHTGSAKEGMAGVDPEAGVPFSDRLGRCYELAGRYMMENRVGTLVHGSIQGYGNPRLGHAWVIDPDGEVFDGTAGKWWPSVEAYNAWANAEEVVSYSWDEAAALMVSEGHWGPWHDRPFGLGDHHDQGFAQDARDGKFASLSDWDNVTLADVRFEVEDRSGTWVPGLGRFDVVAYVDSLSRLPVGRLSVTEYDGEGAGPAGWFIDNAAVIGELRRKGIATAMLAKASQHAGAEVLSTTGPYGDFTADGAAWARSRGFDVSPNAGWNQTKMDVWITGSLRPRFAASDGCMVAIEVPRAVAQALHDQMEDRFGDGEVEPVTQYHVTLAYPGKVDEVNRIAFETAVRDWSNRWGPLTGRLSGFGIFHQDDDSKVLYASVDIPGLEKAREDLVVTLERFGITLPNDHGFTPHLTLKYAGEDEDVTPPEALPDEAKEKFTVSEVAVVFGEDWKHVSLETSYREDIGDGRSLLWGDIPWGAGTGDVAWAPAHDSSIGVGAPETAASYTASKTTMMSVEDLGNLYSPEFEAPLREVPAQFEEYYSWGYDDGLQQQAEQRELVASVREHGILVPLTVDLERGVFLDGHHRYMAAVEVGLTEVPVEDSTYEAMVGRTAEKDPRFEGVTVDEDDDGFYVRTHRARSDSYPTPEDIPQKDVDFIESTGSLQTEAIRVEHPSLPDGFHIEVKDGSLYGTFTTRIVGPNPPPGLGWGFLDLIVTLTPEGSDIYVPRAFIHNDLQGRGIGTAMAQATADLLVQEGFADLPIRWTGLSDGNTDAGNAFIRSLQRAAGVVDDAVELLEAAYEAGDPELPHAVRWYAPTPEGQGWAQYDLREARTTVPPHEFVPMPPANSICNVCDMMESHPVHQAEMQVAAELHDEPEPALPATTGDEEAAEEAASAFVGEETSVADDPDIGAPAAILDEDPSEQGEVIEPGDPRLAWLMSDSSPRNQQGDKEMNIAAAAKAHLAKTALKSFTPAEQKQLIEEGSAEGVVARNLGDLDLTDTHYAALEEALQAVEQGDDDLDWLM